MSLKICIHITLLTLAASIEYQQQVIPSDDQSINVSLQNQGQAHSTPAAYSFQYRVHDEHTGDIKGHSETRNGDRVDGQYDLIDSDGHKRTVQYVADKNIGFQATVHREPTGVRTQRPEAQQHVAYIHVPFGGGRQPEEQQALLQPHEQYIN